MSLLEALDLIERAEKGEIIFSDQLLDAYRVAAHAAAVWNVPVTLTVEEKPQ